MSILEVHDLKKRYGKIQALNGISFNVPKGSVFGVLGPNGSGKTTMLKYQIIQDIRNGKGIAIIDPHGDLAEELLEYIPVEMFDTAQHIASRGPFLVEARIDPVGYPTTPRG